MYIKKQETLFFFLLIKLYRPGALVRIDLASDRKNADEKRDQEPHGKGLEITQTTCTHNSRSIILFGKEIVWINVFFLSRR